MKNTALQILFICNGVFMLGASLLGPLYAVYVQHLGTGIITITNSWAVFLISTTVCLIIVSRVGDKTSKKDLLMAGFLIRAFVWTSYIFIHSVPQLLLIQAILGLGEALGTPAFGSLFAEHLDKNIHVREYADWNVVANCVTAAGTIAGGYIASLYGFQYLFVTMSSLAVLSFIIMFFHPHKLALN